MNMIKFLLEKRDMSLTEIDSFLGKARHSLGGRIESEQRIFVEVIDNILHEDFEKNASIVIDEDAFPDRKNVSVKKVAELSRYFSGEDLVKVLRIKEAEKIVLAPRGKELLAAIAAKI